MKASIKPFAHVVAASMLLLACGDIGDTSDNTKPSTCSISCVPVEEMPGKDIPVEEMPVMDSRARYYEYAAFPPTPPTPPDDKEWGYSLGIFNDIEIGIITDKNMLMQAFPYISDNELAECNYFAVYFSYHYGHRDNWILSEDMVLHQIVPKQAYIACTVPGISEPIVTSACVVTSIPSIPSIAAMLVCDDTPEGNLKDKIDFNSISSHVDPNLSCGL